MAVTIDELTVETQEPPARSTQPASTSQPQHNYDLRAAMERLRERDLRLKAD